METFTLLELRAAWQAACAAFNRANAIYDGTIAAEHAIGAAGTRFSDPAYLVVTRATDAAWATFDAAVTARNAAFAAWERAGT